MPVLKFSGRDVAYRDEGGARHTVSDGPQADLSGKSVLLLIPGLGGTMGFWNPVVDILAPAYRVVSFDHPGMGDSEDPPQSMTVQMLAQLTVALLDHLNIKEAVFVGHSMGGIVSQTAAVRFPGRVKALVLSSTWSKPDHYFQMAFEQRKWLLENGGATAYARAQTLSVVPPEYIAANPGAADEQLERAAKSFRNPAVLGERIDALLAFDSSAMLAQIPQPTLVVSCAGDTVVPPHMSRLLAVGLEQAGANVRQVSLAGGGHFAPMIIPDQFARSVREFCDALPPRLA